MWNKPGVPHRGWQLIAVEDLGSLAAVCEMCETQEIRYVHLVQHSGFPGELGVGCDCAEKMTGDYLTPKTLQSQLSRRDARLRSWLDMSRWKRTASGNRKRKLGERLCVLRCEGSRVFISSLDPETEEWEGGRKPFASPRDALLAIFDHYVPAKLRPQAGPPPPACLPHLPAPPPRTRPSPAT